MLKSKHHYLYQIFTWIVIFMSIIGYLVFLSAVMGRVTGEFSNFILIAVKQLVILILGLSLFFIVSRIDFKLWRKHALVFFLVGLVASLLVFIPGLGIESDGANRWIGIGSFSFQTSELLKLGFVIYFAAWLSTFKEKIRTFKYGFLPLLVLLALSASVLLSQPDTGTTVVIGLAGLAMFIIGGGKWRYVIALGVLGILMITVLAFTRPYVKDRLLTYINPDADRLNSGYQITQSKIAIGSGGLFGRGFGQSLQKFEALPQPIGDSIFSVAGEEFGFIGTTTIVTMFLIFALWSLKIASQTSSYFGRLVVVGIVILILSQSFINIGAMIGVLPLKGIPLVFFSQGGSALLLALIEAGIIRNVARQI